MKAEQGASFHLEHQNLPELERRTGISRARLRPLQESGFVSQPHGRTGYKAVTTALTGYTGLLVELLKFGVVTHPSVMTALPPWVTLPVSAPSRITMQSTST